VERRRLGSGSAAAISVVGYGGWEAGGTAWGTNPPEEQVLAAIQAGFEAGINWVDTAEIYGSGRSEELIGRAIRDRPEIMVSTKVASAPRGTGYEPGNIRRAAEASLRRVGREVIDLYQLHWPDERDVALEDTWAAMAGLVEAGLVHWIGLSNFTEGLIARCEVVRHVDFLQPQLSMLWHERLRLVESCAQKGTGVIAYAPLAFGLLTGTITRRTTFPEDDWRSGAHGLRAYDQLFFPGRFEANLDAVAALRPIAERIGVTLSQLAIAWVLHRDGVSGAIVGSRSPNHVLENAAASSVRLSARDMADIELAVQRRGEVVLPLAPR
jgi:aryl-alcohol dehydrogenase-like predicted oxidoreductase